MIILQGIIGKLIFLNWICGRRGAVFFPIATLNLLNMKSIRDLDFLKEIVIMKREINTFKKFTCEAFPYDISLHTPPFSDDGFELS